MLLIPLKTSKKHKNREQRRKADEALRQFGQKVAERRVFQFGGDASTGLGYCSVTLDGSKKEVAQ